MPETMPETVPTLKPSPSPAPPPAPPAPVPPPPPPPPDRWGEAVAAARDLALAACRSSRCFPVGCGSEVGADLRRTATAVALELEQGPRRPARLMASLRALWRAGDLVDKAERLGLLDLEAAVELLALGSKVEIPLVVCVQAAGGSLGVRGEPLRASAGGPAPAQR